MLSPKLLQSMKILDQQELVDLVQQYNDNDKIEKSHDILDKVNESNLFQSQGLKMIKKNTLNHDIS